MILRFGMPEIIEYGLTMAGVNSLKRRHSDRR
jgi:hypothetical protein